MRSANLNYFSTKLFFFYTKRGSFIEKVTLEEKKLGEAILIIPESPGLSLVVF